MKNIYGERTIEDIVKMYNDRLEIEGLFPILPVTDKETKILLITDFESSVYVAQSNEYGELGNDNYTRKTLYYKYIDVNSRESLFDDSTNVVNICFKKEHDDMREVITYLSSGLVSEADVAVICVNGNIIFIKSSEYSRDFRDHDFIECICKES